jgi:hypothetical protein
MRDDRRVFMSTVETSVLCEVTDETEETSEDQNSNPAWSSPWGRPQHRVAKILKASYSLMRKSLHTIKFLTFWANVLKLFKNDTANVPEMSRSAGIS